MLAHSAKQPFSSPDHIFEAKWDGIRAISYIADSLSIKGRRQTELTHKFPELHELQTLAPNTVVDGEIVVLQNGTIDFQLVLRRMQAVHASEIQHLAAKHPATYVLFDILELNGDSLIHHPLMKRKAILKNRVTESPHIVISNYIETDGKRYYHAALLQGFEGIIAKHKQSPYSPGRRSRAWIKIKQILTCDCVVAGFTQGRGNRANTFGALVLGLYDNGTLIHVGQVGTGFTDHDLGQLHTRMIPLITPHASIRISPPRPQVTWIQPQLVAQIAYQTLTHDGKLRFARYLGLRDDKTAHDCTIKQFLSLTPYQAKRSFHRSPEPPGDIQPPTPSSPQQPLTFVIQKHQARRLHYDFRLEREGVLKSWAVPRGIPQTNEDKRLAIQTEDHPLEYQQFEGEIPQGQYGAGTVEIVDHGIYSPIKWENRTIEILLAGKVFTGRYIFVRFNQAGKNHWLLMKKGE
jgi:DNA ligase D-like protein (predicted ligase)/DNA ligase D-like protein (predicted 3'-phosphoesterase)